MNMQVGLVSDTHGVFDQVICGFEELYLNDSGVAGTCCLVYLGMRSTL